MPHSEGGNQMSPRVEVTPATSTFTLVLPVETKSTSWETKWSTPISVRESRGRHIRVPRQLPGEVVAELAKWAKLRQIKTNGSRLNFQSYEVGRDI